MIWPAKSRKQFYNNIILWTHADDAMKLLKCKSVSFQWDGENTIWENNVNLKTEA